MQAGLQYFSLNAHFAFGRNHASRRHAAPDVASFLDRNFPRADIHKDAPQNDEQHDQKKENNYHDGEKRKDVDVIHGSTSTSSGEHYSQPGRELDHGFALAASSSRRAPLRVRFKTKPAPELLVREESTQNSPSNKARSSTGEISASFRSRHNPSAFSTVSR